jgi:hypothetical protein
MPHNAQFRTPQFKDAKRPAAEHSGGYLRLRALLVELAGDGGFPLTGGLWVVGHDAVVGAPGACAAGAGAVAGEHLRGRPSVQLHQVTFLPAAFQPGMAEVMPEPVRPDLNPRTACPGG